MKNIQWKLIARMVAIASFIFISAHIFFQYLDPTLTEQPEWGWEGYFLFLILCLLFIFTPIRVAILAKERKGFHAFLTFLFLLLTYLFLAALRLLYLEHR